MQLESRREIDGRRNESLVEERESAALRVALLLREGKKKKRIKKILESALDRQKALAFRGWSLHSIPVCPVFISRFHAGIVRSHVRLVEKKKEKEGRKKQWSRLHPFRAGKHSPPSASSAACRGRRRRRRLLGAVLCGAMRCEAVRGGLLLARVTDGDRARTGRCNLRDFFFLIFFT